MRAHDAECRAIAEAAREWMEAHFLLDRDACFRQTTIECLVSQKLAASILQDAMNHHAEFEIWRAFTQGEDDRR